MSKVSRRDLVQWMGAMVPIGVLAEMSRAARADGPAPPTTPAPAATPDQTNTAQTAPAAPAAPATAAPAAPATPPAPAPPPSTALEEAHVQEIIATVKPAVVLLEVETEDGMAWGSAFFVSSDGLLVTNRHVVKDAQRLTCLYKNSTRLPATIVQVDSQYDLALVSVKVPSPVATVALGDSDNVNAGQLVAVTGYPQPKTLVWMGIALDSSTSRGSLNGPRFGGDVNTLLGDTALQIDAPVTFGNSGSPVFRLDTGEVIGVLARGMPGANNITFAVPINPVKVLVSSAGIKPQHNVVAADSADAVVNPGELRTLNTVTVTKELPPLFGYGFPVIGDYTNGDTDTAVNDWTASTGLRLSRVTPMALDGEEIFFGSTDGKLRKWNLTEFSDDASILMDTGDGTIFTYAPVANGQIICATSGALDLSTEMRRELTVAGAAVEILTAGLFGGASTKSEVTIDGVGHIFGLNRKNGNIDWEVDTGFVGTPVLADNRVYYGGVGERGCLDAFQGNQIWRNLEKEGSKADWYYLGYAGPAGVFGVAVPVEGKQEKDDQPLRLYGRGKARVERYDPGTGKVLWKSDIGDVQDRTRPLSTAMFVDPQSGTVYALAVQIVAAVEPTSGKVLWTYDQAKVMEQEMKKQKDAKEKAQKLSFTSNMLIQDGVIYVGSSDRKLHALDGANGSELWTYNTRGEIGPPTYYDGQILFGSGDGYIHVIDSHTGALVWRAYTGSPVRAQPLVYNGMVYAATEAGDIYTIRIPVA